MFTVHQIKNETQFLWSLEGVVEVHHKGTVDLNIQERESKLHITEMILLAYMSIYIPLLAYVSIYTFAVSIYTIASIREHIYLCCEHIYLC